MPSLEAWNIVLMPTIIFCCIFALYCLLCQWKRWGKHKLNRAIARASSRRAQISAQLYVALSEENSRNHKTWARIVQLPFNQLRDELQAEEVGPVQVLHAFQWQALAANQKTNCVTSFFVEAEGWATELEKLRGQNKPPLYGIPFAIKENFQMKGSDCTRGFAQFLDNPCDSEPLLVEAFREMGAVPFAHTNVPQALLSWMCANPIYGTTTHPLNAARTPGGSSGGAAALIAMDASPFVLGTDTGGSVRTPAHFCGICGFKPTMSRVTKMNMRAAGIAPGVTGVAGGPGPMAKDVSTLVSLLKNLWADSSIQFARDPYVVPLVFQEKLFSSHSPLRIGYYSFDNYLEVVPACGRAIQMATGALEKQGHTLLEWNPPDVWEAMELFRTIINIGGDCVQDLLSSDIPEPLLAPYYSTLTGNKYLRHIRSRIVAPFAPRYALYLRSVACDVPSLRRTYAKIAEYKARFVRAWHEAGIDCLVCPVTPCPAPNFSQLSSVFSCTSYAMLFNLLDFPAGVVPVTTVEEDDAKLAHGYRVIDQHTQAIKDVSLETSMGMPLGVQCVALPFRDETCLRLMHEIELNLL